LDKYYEEETAWDSKTSYQNKNDDEEQEEEIIDYEDALKRRLNFSNELAHEAAQDLEKLTLTISKVLRSKKNWIVSDIKKENNEVVKVELKPLNISPYCKPVFDRCSRVLIMSATILNAGAFCRTVGLDPDIVKFMQLESDFPLENRPIISLDVAPLNYKNLQSAQVQDSVARTVDKIMSFHENDKGIIHTTSYDQLNFIRNNISGINAQRLLETNPAKQRDQVIEQHICSVEPTVLISPSFHTGIDLKDNLSRFQIITKVPYPNMGDRWTNAKRKADQGWYYWQTALKLIQAYGRSIRSKDNWAKTYVLDSTFVSFVAVNASMFPNWFTQAIIKGDGRMYSSSTHTTSKNIAIQVSQQRVICTRLEKECASILDYSEEKPAHSHNLLNRLGSNGLEKDSHFS
jgi:ATP-dependent DNA helicase DinG